MPAQEIAFLTETAVLWLADGGYDAYGQPTVGSATELTPPYNGVRWNDVQSEALDPKGNTITLDATVIVAQDVPINSHMWLGTLSDWNGTGSGVINEQLYEVKTVNTTKDLKGRYSTRSLGLIRLHGKGAN